MGFFGLFGGIFFDLLLSLLTGLFFGGGGATGM